LLKQVGKNIVAASDHQNYPIPVLLKQMGRPLVRDEPSLMDTAIIVENIHDPEHCRPIHPRIIFTFRIEEDAVKGDIAYHAHLYEESTIRRVLTDLEQVLEKALLHLDTPLSQLSISSPEALQAFPGGNQRHAFIKGYPFRVEKIEERLLEHPDIDEAAVILKETANETGAESRNQANPLYAYFTSGKDVNPSELKEQLARILPHYLVPGTLVRLEKMPSTPLHEMEKDPGALAEMEARLGARDRYALPADEVEEKLLDIWAEVLETDKEEIRLDEDFARWGGHSHSLKVIAMTSRIHKEFGLIIRIPDVFRLSTITGLAGHIREVSDTAKAGFRSIEPVEKKEYYPVSNSQKRLYLLEQLFPESTGYNVTQMVTLEGDLDRRRLQEAFKRLIQRHETLRTTFHITGDVPVQKVHDHIEFELKYYDLTGKPPGAALEEERKITGAFARPFDLSRPPLLRVELIKKSESLHILMADRHHIISDAASRQIFLNDILALYRDRELPPLVLQYKDFSEWQNSPEQQTGLERQEKYWLRQFRETIPLMDLPADYDRPRIQSVEGAALYFNLDMEETLELDRVAEQESVTVFMVLLAAYNIFLSKICSQEDIVIGTPVVGRRHADLENIMGIFINTLPMRNYPRHRHTVKEFLADLKTRTLNAFENQTYPFEQLVDKVSVKRDHSRNPLFDAFFTLTYTGVPDDGAPGEETPGLEMLPYKYGNHVSIFDLSLSARKSAEGVYFIFDYCSKLFKEETVARFTRYFKRIVTAVLTGIDQEIKQIEILDQSERQRLLVDFNRTEAVFPTGATISRLFEAQVERTPHHIGLVFNHSQLTYLQLNRRAEGLARRLNQCGVGADRIVGIMMERSLEMIISVLAILKAGGAYLPIDPDYPEERIDFMLKDSGTKVIVSNGLKVKRLSGTGEPTSQPTNRQTNLAYIIYTSGSTGYPKGVAVEHASVVNLVFSQIRRFAVDEKDRVLQFSSLAFDASVEQVFISLCSGAVLVLVDKDTLLDRDGFGEFLLRRSITHLHAVPSFLDTIELTPAYPLKRIIAGGDICPLPLARRLSRPGLCEFYNEYGPTETTVTSLELMVGEDVARMRRLPIGRPIDNTVVYLLDKWKKPVPVGVVGELYVGGRGVARGYLNRPQLTAERFIYLFESLIYRTGDLGRWLTDGNIDFLGRSDHQVKIRGFRVELEEIEKRLTLHETVKEAVVIAGQDAGGDRYLCAYVVAEAGLSDVTQLSRYLSNRLPHYMVPPYIVQIEKIPLTPNGKVDKQALPEPGIQTGENFVAPRDAVEEHLAGIWREVLVRPGDGPGELTHGSIGIDDDFFQLGGHSLRATVLVSRVHKVLDVKLPLMEVFRNPTIRGLARCIKGMEKSTYRTIEPVEEKDYYPLSSAQKRLYFLRQMDPGSTGYNIHNVFPVGKDLDIQRLETVLMKLVARHESLRSSFVPVDNVAVQRVHHPRSIDFSMDYYEADNDEVEAIIARYRRPFDLSKAPLFRSAMIKRPDGDFTWLVDIHHIISDGTSMAVLTEDFAALYAGQVLPGLKLRYKDFSQWQNRLFETGAIKAQEEYWLQQLEGEIPRLELPVDYKRPEVFDFSGDYYRFAIEGEEVMKFRRLGTRNGGTLYMNILAVLNTLFYKYTGQTDIIIGTGIAGRPHADLQQIIGMFINTLAIRNYPSGDKTYEMFLKEVAGRSVDAFENQDLQFEELVGKLQLERDTSQNPLFDVTMVVQNFLGTGATRQEEETGPQFERLPAPTGIHPVIRHRETTSKFDMSFLVIEEGDNVFVSLEYYKSIFKHQTITRFAGHLKNVIKAVIADASIPLEELDILSEHEKQALLEQFNDTRTDYPREKTIGQLFRDQVRQTPDHTAVVFREESLSYKDLDERSNPLAHYLYHETGIRPNRTVGLLMDRSLEMIVAIFGVLKAGGAYVPLSPSFPGDRIKTMLEDAGSRVLIGQDHHIREINPVLEACENLESILRIDNEGVFPGRGESCVRPPRIAKSTPFTIEPQSANYAYIIYTSGSTGQPKGNLTTHYNVTRVVKDTNYIHFSPSDRVLQLSDYAFDGSVFDIFGALLNGSALVMIRQEDLLDVEGLARMIEGENISIFFVTTALFNTLVDIGLDCLVNVRKVLFGGERVSVEHTAKAAGY
ncbi:MAG: amino acid adenylation domain-containing protein, partial [bacterium]|nr:amino acid adenylation domain-containing protein [bacterium]